MYVCLNAPTLSVSVYNNTTVSTVDPETPFSLDIDWGVEQNDKIEKLYVQIDGLTFIENWSKNNGGSSVDGLYSDDKTGIFDADTKAAGKKSYTFYPAEGAAAGSYTVKVWFEDTSGNKSNVETYTLKLKDYITGTPATQSVSSSGDRELGYTFTWSGEMASIDVSIDNGATIANGWVDAETFSKSLSFGTSDVGGEGINSYVFTKLLLADDVEVGEYTVTVTMTNKAGVTSDPWTGTVKVYTKAAMITNLESAATSVFGGSDKKTCAVEIAEMLLENDFEPAFIAGVLGNIKSEGSCGFFENIMGYT